MTNITVPLGATTLTLTAVATDNVGGSTTSAPVILTVLPDQPPTSMGFSTGHWEERMLVIETTHLSPGWLDGSGYPMTGGDGTRIVERWTVADDGLTMDRTMTIEDDYYTEPLLRTRGSQRGNSNDLLESPPCDATPFYYELMQRGELEQQFK